MTANVSRARRDFLQGAGLLFAGSAAYAVAPNFAYAANNAKLQTLADVCYALYPHRRIPRKFYLACAQGYLDKAGKDEQLTALIDGGLARLDGVFSRPFSQLHEKDRAAALARIHGGDFFNSVRGHTVVGLYNIPGIWNYFGYQGPSHPHGGYLERGFDDIFWLRDI
jgi:hypothetical protein